MDTHRIIATVEIVGAQHPAEVLIGEYASEAEAEMRLGFCEDFPLRVATSRLGERIELGRISFSIEEI